MGSPKQQHAAGTINGWIPKPALNPAALRRRDLSMEDEIPSPRSEKTNTPSKNNIDDCSTSQIRRTDDPTNTITDAVMCAPPTTKPWSRTRPIGEVSGDTCSPQLVSGQDLSNKRPKPNISAAHATPPPKIKVSLWNICGGSKKSSDLYYFFKNIKPYIMILAETRGDVNNTMQSCWSGAKF